MTNLGDGLCREEDQSYLTAMLIMLIGFWPVLLPAACGLVRTYIKWRANDGRATGTYRPAVAA